MKVVHGTIEGPFSAEEDIVIHGMITAGATLREGVKLILHGMITGNLVIEPQARAVIHGTVNGAILNYGGRVELFGTADAVADRSPDAVTVVNPTALVREQRDTRNVV